IYFTHGHDDGDWILEQKMFRTGTGVFMTLGNNTSKDQKKIFGKFTSQDEYDFTKTIVPVKLVQYSDESLISRSQAKRLLSRVDKFKTVILDYEGVDSIGQAFADEIFRVFRMKNKDTDIYYMNANREVEGMITRTLLIG
ncbi:unnamed protein product, partial [marine sediment metagenome]